MTQATTRRIFAACLLALLGATVSVGNVRSATSGPLLEIYDMTKFPATVIVERDGKPDGHYALAPYGRAGIYGTGNYLFKGTVEDPAGKVVLPTKETTLLTGATARGLTIQASGKTIIWVFGRAASGSYI